MEAQAPRLAPDRQIVQGYRAGGFTVSGLRHVGSLLLFPDRTLAWPVATMAELGLAALEPVRTTQPVPDILIIGTGAEFALCPPELRQAVRVWGPVVETMATPAACRTYNLLVAEERRVAAALIAMPA
jgi:uncharacterized protein